MEYENICNKGYLVASMATELLTIKQVSALTELSIDTLRYYEKIGLIPAVPRSASGHRIYGLADLNIIQFLLKLRATGMSIADMCHYVSLIKQGYETFEARCDLLEQHARKVKDEIALLSYNLLKLEEKIRLYQHWIVERDAGQVLTRFNFDTSHVESK